MSPLVRRKIPFSYRTPDTAILLGEYLIILLFAFFV
jgi:hypothetical protein